MTDAQINFSETNTPQTHLEPTAKHAGRPRLFKTPEEMQAKIDAYFDTRKPTQMRDDKGEIIFNNFGIPLLKDNPPTVSGLALFLGFSSRQGLSAYGDTYEEFFDIVKTAVTRIENAAETALFTQAKPTGAIFWLKNHKWNAEEKRDEAHIIDLSGSLKVDNAQTVKEAVQEVLNECFDTPPTPKQ